MSIFSQTEMGDRSVFEIHKATLSEGLEPYKKSHIRLLIHYVEYVGDTTPSHGILKSCTIDMCEGNPDFVAYQREHKRPGLRELQSYSHQSAMCSYYSSFLNDYFKDYPQMQGIIVSHCTAFLC